MDKTEKITENSKPGQSLSPEQQTLTLQQALDLGLQHHTAGRLPEAEKIYQQVLQTDPDQPVALHLIGVIAHQVGDNNRAVDLIKKALTIKPDVAEAHCNLATALRELGKPEEAVANYQNALALKPDYAEACSNLGGVFKEIGQPDKAVITCRRAIEIKPDFAEAHSNLGAALKELGRLGEAVESYQKALDLKPDYTNAHYSLGIVLQELGQLDKAVETYQKAIAIRPDHAEANFNLGNALKELRQLDEAVASYHKALDIKPDYAEVHGNLGNALRELGQLDEAVASHHKALNINPYFVEAHINLGNVFKELGKLDKAVDSYRRAIEIQPDFAEGYCSLGIVLGELGQLDEAVSSYDKALTIKPDYVEAHCNLGATFRELGQLERSVASSHKALAIKSDCTEAHYNLGLTLLDQGRLDEAITSCQMALAIKPDFAEAHNNLGNALQEQGKLEKAVASYQKALDFKPGYAKAHNNLGVLHKELGQIDEAIASYYKALKIKPDFVEVFNNIWLSLLPMHHDIITNQRDASSIEQIIDSLPTPPEPEILRLQFNSLTGENTQEAWESVIGNMPTIQSETIFNDNKITSPSTVISENQSQRKMVALLHFGRSGSVYLHSLLDGHPTVSTLPGVYMSGFFGRGVWKHVSCKGFQGLPEQFSLMYKVLFDARNPEKIPPAFVGDDYTINSVGVKEGFLQMGPNRDTPLTLDRSQFLEFLSKAINGLESINHGQFFEAIHHAYEKTLGGDFGDKRLIFYHLHKIDPYSMANFLKYFPNAQLLMIIRNPLQSIESWALQSINTKNNNQENPYKTYQKIVQMINPMLVDLNSPAFQAQDCAAVRLEDIKVKPVETMRRLCNYLGIKESASLYASTMQGLKWWGDPSSSLFGRTQTLYDEKDDPTQRETGAFYSATDQFVLKTLFYPFSARFGYVEEDDAQFRKDLREIRPLLDKPLDFEQTLAEELLPSYPDLPMTGAFKSFHSVLTGLWHQLDEHGTYPYMVKDLPE